MYHVKMSKIEDTCALLGYLAWDRVELMMELLTF